MKILAFALMLPERHGEASENAEKAVRIKHDVLAYGGIQTIQMAAGHI